VTDHEGEKAMDVRLFKGCGERGCIYAIQSNEQWSHAVAGIDGSIASIEAERKLAQRALQKRE
jgi:hypothetical protein